MERKTTLIYKAEEVTVYDELLKAIITMARNADLQTNIAELSVAVTFDNSYLEEVDALKDNIGEMPVTITEKPFMFAADIEAEEKMLAEAARTKDALDLAIAKNEALLIEKSKLEEDRNKYKQWWQEASSRNCKLLGQVEAIATLLNGLLPK